MSGPYSAEATVESTLCRFQRAPLVRWRCSPHFLLAWALVLPGCEASGSGRGASAVLRRELRPEPSSRDEAAQTAFAEVAAATELAEGEPGFVLGDEGRCPSGSERVFDAEECRNAGKAVHFSAPKLSTNLQIAETVDCRPAGCAAGGDNSLLLHKGSVGEGKCCGCVVICKESSAGSLGAKCPRNIDMPNPFKMDSLMIYDREGLLSMNIALNPSELEQTWSPLAAKAQELINSCDGRAAFARLLGDGMTVSPFGIDFSKVQEKRYGGTISPGAPFQLPNDKDILLLRQTYFSTRIHKLFFDTDMRHWYQIGNDAPLGLSQGESSLLSSLRRDGFVKVDSWGDINIEKLSRSISEHKVINLAGANGNSSGGKEETKAWTNIFLGKDVAGLDEEELSKSLIGKLVRGYLGADVEFHGTQHMTLNPTASKRSYSNAPWHHDGCGQRLKAFIYLGDVDDHTHPTLIAAGTHHTQWYPTTHYFAGHKGHNKLDENLVNQKYGQAVRKMTAPKGGGFIFDTNALHAAEMRGEHKKREALLLEFASVDHMRAMDRSDRNGEDGGLSGFEDGLCPSAGHPEKFHWDYVHG